MQILTSGVMRAQAGGLNMNDRVAVATFLTVRLPWATPAATPETNLCKEEGAAAGPETGSNWNGWGGDLTNARAFSPSPDSRLTTCPV